MKPITPLMKLNIQLGIAVFLVVTGIGLLLSGFCVKPTGEIHNSVLVAFGECCTFAGSLIGVDYHYRYKVFSDERKPEHRNHEVIFEEDEKDN